MERKVRRGALTLAAAGFVVVFLVYAFWPRAELVDMARVSVGPMEVAIVEEAKTRVHDVYTLSAPVTGRLLRVDVHAGDLVVQGETVLARLSPSDPTFLDVRAREQAEAAVRSADAALALAKAEVNRAEAEAELAAAEVKRTRNLFDRGTVAQAALDRAETALRTSRAALATARANVQVRQAELTNAEARLVTPAEAEASASGVPDDALDIRAPIDGCVLRLLQQSEMVVAAGTPIMEIGDPRGDLEVIAELLSSDAAQVSAGDRVVIDKWGAPGAPTLGGVVDRVEPFGFTKYSALGVEEQRVNVVIALDALEDADIDLGHGFRVESRIVIWETDDALIAPSSALFRAGDDWAIFKVENGRARLQKIRVGRTNGLQAQILEGLSPGDTVVLYPSDRLADGGKVAQRPDGG